MITLSWLVRAHVVLTREGPIAYLRIADPTGIVGLRQDVQARQAEDLNGIYALRIGLLQVWPDAGAIRTITVRSKGHEAIKVLSGIIGDRGQTCLAEAMTAAQSEYAELRDQSNAEGDSSITLIGTGTADGSVGKGALLRLNESAYSVYSQVDYSAHGSHERLEEVPIF